MASESSDGELYAPPPAAAAAAAAAAATAGSSSHGSLAKSRSTSRTGLAPAGASQPSMAGSANSHAAPNDDDEARLDRDADYVDENNEYDDDGGGEPPADYGYADDELGAEDGEYGLEEVHEGGEHFAGDEYGLEDGADSGNEADPTRGTADRLRALNASYGGGEGDESAIAAEPDYGDDENDVLLSPRDTSRGGRAPPTSESLSPLAGGGDLLYERESVHSDATSELRAGAALSRGPSRASGQRSAARVQLPAVHPGSPTDTRRPTRASASASASSQGSARRRAGGAGGMGAGSDEDSSLDDGDGELYDRDALVHALHVLAVRNYSLRETNLRLQHNIQCHFDAEAAEHRINNEAAVLSGRDHEKQYQQSIVHLEELRAKIEADNRVFRAELDALESALTQGAQREEEARALFLERKRVVASQAVHSRKGTLLPPPLVAHLEARQAAKDEEVSLVRLRNIKLTNQKDALLARIEAMERENSLHVIDFEQKKIENQTYNEKIEERNEELLKLRRKLTTTVQILTHVREKLEYVRRENARLRLELADVRHGVEAARLDLSQRKAQRDRLRSLNVTYHEQAGLVGDYNMLRDYEHRTEAVSELQATLAELQERHRTLTRQTEKLVAKQSAYTQKLRAEMLLPPALGAGAAGAPTASMTRGPQQQLQLPAQRLQSSPAQARRSMPVNRAAAAAAASTAAARSAGSAPLVPARRRLQ